jgi:glutaredoxin
MLTLYQVEWCPSCHAIRQVLTELGLTYTAVNVPCKQEERANVMAVSGQASVPVLQDGDRVLTDSAIIADYLRSVYPARADSPDHAAKGEWRISRHCSMSAHATLSRLRQLLLAQGYEIVSETKGADISETFPKDYVLLGVLLPEAAAQAHTCDPHAASALITTIAITAEAAGSTGVAVADPVGNVWLYADAALRRVQSGARQKLVAALAAL